MVHIRIREWLVAHWQCSVSWQRTDAAKRNVEGAPDDGCPESDMSFWRPWDDGGRRASRWWLELRLCRAGSGGGGTWAHDDGRWRWARVPCQASKLN